MYDRLPRSLRIQLLILVLLSAIWHATPAVAHKVVVFATAEGKTIEGEVYFRGGIPARQVKVTAVGPQGELLGKTTTDEEGKFSLAVRFRCDHRLIADAGEGHGAEYTVAGEQLPDDLPSLGSPGQPSTGQAGKTETPSTVNQNQGSAPAESAQIPIAIAGNQDLRAGIQALGKQIAALRRDLDKYNNQLRLQDILGGIGYILGIMGLVFYFLGVRRKEKKSASTD